jgi:hypothetical protein
MADPRGGWTTVDSLRPGAVFVRRDGSVWTRGFYRDAAGREADCLPHAHPFAASTLPADTPARPLDVPALARENADLRAMVADLWEESRAFAAGVEVGRGEALAALQELSPQSVTHSGTALISRTLVTALDAVRALGPARPPLRPHALEAEVERLREALRGLVDGISRDGPASEVGPKTPCLVDIAAVWAAVAALGDDA